MNFRIKVYPLLVFIGMFILFTPIGTLSHEYGHVAVAQYLGYETELYYGSMSWRNGPNSERLNTLYKTHEEAIKNKSPFPERVEYEALLLKRKRDDLWITIGGPVQTISVGCLGLLILFFRRQRWRIAGFNKVDWLAVFLSLFWLREVFNLVVSVATGILNGGESYFGSRGDEVRVSKLLGLAPGTFPLLLGFLGLLVACFVIFRVVPKDWRFTFILGGLVGGVIGFVLWMEVLGPVLLP